MKLILKPVGERATKSNRTEVFEGDRSELFKQAIQFIDDGDIVDDDDPEQVAQYLDTVTLELAVAFINEWCGEWKAQIVTS